MNLLQLLLLLMGLVIFFQLVRTKLGVLLQGKYLLRLFVATLIIALGQLYIQQMPQMLMVVLKARVIGTVLKSGEVNLRMTCTSFSTSSKESILIRS